MVVYDVCKLTEFFSIKLPSSSQGLVRLSPSIVMADDDPSEVEAAWPLLPTLEDRNDELAEDELEKSVIEVFDDCVIFLSPSEEELLVDDFDSKENVKGILR